MKKHILTYLTILATSLTLFENRANELIWEEPDEFLYSYDIPLNDQEEANYIYAESNCNPCLRQNGIAYYNSRSIACYTTGIIIGVAIIAGMVAIVVNQSKCAHSH